MVSIKFRILDLIILLSIENKYIDFLTEMYKELYMHIIYIKLKN